jgi:hypothetical protein
MLLLDFSKPLGTDTVFASRPAYAVPGLLDGLVPVADGIRLHYVVTDEGDPVLLIPVGHKAAMLGTS